MKYTSKNATVPKYPYDCKRDTDVIQQFNRRGAQKDNQRLRGDATLKRLETAAVVHSEKRF